MDQNKLTWNFVIRRLAVSWRLSPWQAQEPILDSQIQRPSRNTRDRDPSSPGAGRSCVGEATRVVSYSVLRSSTSVGCANSRRTRHRIATPISWRRSISHACNVFVLIGRNAMTATAPIRAPVGPLDCCLMHRPFLPPEDPTAMFRKTGRQVHTR